MNDATLTAYKQEFFQFALLHEDLSYVPLVAQPVTNQKVFAFKIVSLDGDYVGSLKNNKLLVRDEVVAVLSQYGYTPTDSVVIAPTLGLNTAATYPSNSTNMYTSFCNTGTDAGIWLRDHVTSLVRQASNSEILNNSLNMVIQDWLYVPLLTTVNIDAKKVFINISQSADESLFTTTITI